MGKGFKHGACDSNPLNFKVVGGTAQPSNPKENTIWVNTDQEITSWLFADFAGSITETAGTVFGTINGRTFSKTTNGKAAWAMVYNGIHSGPMLVAPSIDACSYSTNDGFVGKENTPESIEYNGVTYYYHAQYWYSGDNTGGYRYVVKASSNQEAALMLAKLYEVSNEGTVCISIDTSGDVEFNALKKNGIMVYPVSTKQFVNGAWMDKPVKIYQNGAWTELPDPWDGTLYKEGNEYVDVTGGWTGDGTKESWYLYVSGYTHYVNFKTAKKINLTNVTKLTAIGGVNSTFSNGLSVTIGVTPSGAENCVASAHFGGVGSNKVIELDVSNVTGEYYIIFYAGLSSSCQGYVTEVRIS